MFTYARYGGYECSSHGDKRFSALFAKLADGRTIEMHYQCDVKGYQPGGIGTMRDWMSGIVVPAPAVEATTAHTCQEP